MRAYMQASPFAGRAVNVGAHSLRILSIATGGGGLDRAVELAVPGAGPVCCIEREAFAISVLVEAMRKGAMADCPVWTDAKTFRGRTWRRAVDIVTAGYPCQPFSLAGKRGGVKDERHLWPTVRRIIVQSGAWCVFLENVGGHLSLGADQVLRDLARLGFACEVGLFSAAEVGASHERERLFILGVLDDPSRFDGRLYAGRGRSEQGAIDAGGRGQELADSDSGNGDGRRVQRSGRRRQSTDRSLAMANTDKPLVCRESSAGQLGVDERDVGACGQDGSGALADANGAGPTAYAGDASEVGSVQEEKGQPGHGPALLGRSGSSMAHAGHAGPQGRGPSGDRSGECEASERSGEHVDDSAGPRHSERQSGAGGSLRDETRRSGLDGPSVGLELAAGERRGEGRSEPVLRSGRHPSCGSVGAVDHAVRGRHRNTDEALCPGRHGPLNAGDDRPMVNPDSRVRDGRPCQPVGEPFGRTAPEQPSPLPVFAPGPGDAEAWAFIAEHYPERLPAISRHDLFSIALRKALAAHDGNPSAREGLDQEEARKVRAAIVQAVAESHLRKLADGRAPRIDQLRLLGNGVVEVEGARAFDVLARRVAPRSANATLLVRMMDQ